MADHTSPRTRSQAFFNIPHHYSALTPLLRTPEAARYLSLSPRTLEKLRVTGGGPPYIRLGRRAIVYDPTDLAAWAASRRRRSTSDPGREGSDA